ncbi:MAG: hypothetical protein HY000_23110, partial [Planctomycetes bacterium]|nr:hypothetical protein [Planctomycetota bacterium]
MQAGRLHYGRDLPMPLRTALPTSDLRLPTSFVAALLLLGLSSSAPAADPGMMKLQIGEQWVEGKPLFWSQKQVQLLARDGRLWDVSPSVVRNFVEIGGAFRSYPGSD